MKRGVVIKVKYIYLWIFLLFQIYVSGQDLHTDAESKSCLWKIEKDSGQVYLAGSIHLLKKEHYPLKPVFEDALKEADLVVFEVNLDSIQTMQTQLRIMTKAMFQDGITLQSVLPDSTFKLAKEVCKELGLDINQWQNFKPWYFTLMILNIKLIQLGFDPNYGIDQYLFQKAKGAGKQIEGLESIEFQISLFEKMVKEDQELLVRHTLAEMDVLEKEFDKIYLAWRDGKPDELDQLLHASMKEFPALYDHLLLDRNRTWLPQIKHYLKSQKTVMIIVGAGHLVVENSLIRMLQSEGFITEQM